MEYKQYNYNKDFFLFVETPVIGHLIKYWDNQISTPITYWLLENFPIFPMIRLGVEQSKINLYPKIKAH